MLSSSSLLNSDHYIFFESTIMIVFPIILALFFLFIFIVYTITDVPISSPLAPLHAAPYPFPVAITTLSSISMERLGPFLTMMRVSAHAPLRLGHCRESGLLSQELNKLLALWNHLPHCTLTHQGERVLFLPVHLLSPQSVWRQNHFCRMFSESSKVKQYSLPLLSPTHPVPSRRVTSWPWFSSRHCTQNVPGQ